MNSKESFVTACQENDAELVREMLAGTGLQVLHIGLYKACTKGNTAVVELLLEDGRADPNAKTGFMSSALYIACYQGHTKVVELLLKNGRADPNVDAAFRSPLHAARSQGHMEIEKLLLADSRCQPISANSMAQDNNNEGDEPQASVTILDAVKSAVASLVFSPQKQGYKQL